VHTVSEVLRCKRHPEAKAIPTKALGDGDVTWRCLVCLDELPLKVTPEPFALAWEEDTGPSDAFWEIPKRR
jgi:hypothetical protein